MAKNILHMLTPLAHMSPFDINMAIDAGYDATVPYTHVGLNEVSGLVQDAMFSRPPRDAARTGVFIAGKDAFLALDMLDAAAKALFKPFEISLFADPAGSFTTAAATIAVIERTLREKAGRRLAGISMSIFGATGVVGTAAGVIGALEGARVTLVGYDGTARVSRHMSEVKRRFGVDVSVADGSTPQLKAAIVASSEVVLCAGRAGVRVLDAGQIEGAANLLVAADVNAVPPLGIEGLGSGRECGAAGRTRRGGDWRARDRQCEISDGVGSVQTDGREQDAIEARFPSGVRSRAHVCLTGRAQPSGRPLRFWRSRRRSRCAPSPSSVRASRSVATAPQPAAARLNRSARDPMLDAEGKMFMSAAFRAAIAITFLAVTPAQTFGQGPPKVDPDWPCPQVKTAAFSLASVWSGPAIDLNDETWRDEPDVVDLATKMFQRRVPIEEVEKSIAEFKAKSGGDADAKLLRAFGAAFQNLTRQRSEVIDGLDRFGRKEHEMADRIRAENDSVQKAADQNKNGQAQPADDSFQRLEWDIRVFDDQRRTVSYVCDSPALIERRLGRIARAVQQAL